MHDNGLIDPDDPLERQNAKLRKIVGALMDRVERNTDQTGNAYSLFQRAIALEGEVQARTRDLQRTLEELNRVNSELEAASAVADEANRAKSRFVAAASHDVRQPLNAAKLFLASLGETDLADHQRAILDRLANAFQSVEGLLGSLLDISRLDSSSARAEKTRFPVADLLGPLIDEMAPVAAQSGIELRYVSGSQWIESDPFYLRQIVQNLVSNAIQYCCDGRVLVGCRRRGRDISIEIHDTGPGIAEDDLPLIFEEFRRLPSNADRARTEGAGLGLAIVKRASALLGHTLGVRSTPGSGTCFSIVVPRDDPKQTEPEGRAESAETPIVLVVSRDPEVVDRVLSLLNDWGSGGITATSLIDGWKAIEQLGVMPDAVLIDHDVVGSAQNEPLADLLSGPSRAAILSPSNGVGAELPSECGALPRLDRSIRPYRLRAVLLQSSRRSIDGTRLSPEAENPTI